MAIETANGVVVGEIVGDGVGVTVKSGSIDAVEICFKIRLDVRKHADLFTQADVARLVDGELEVQYFDASALKKVTGTAICADVPEVGTYFPIYRKSGTQADLDALTCSVDCDSSGGVCVNGDTCVCKCGFSGDSCEEGCPFSCNDGGICASFNSCECDDNRTGSSCAEVLCPRGGRGNTYCSGNGNCLSDATCSCAAGCKYSYLFLFQSLFLQMLSALPVS